MKYIKWFKQISIKDVQLVGGKNASLGEMFQNLTKAGINIPNGFCITAEGYKYFLKYNKLEKKIPDILSGLNTKNVKDLAKRGSEIREMILSGRYPDDLMEEIIVSYSKLSKKYPLGKYAYVDVAVRSSATAEDLPSASFAGQQETYLNIRGEHNLLDSIKRCFASLFTDRAISYREDKGFSHLKIFLSVGIQKMVRSDLASSGVMFTIDTETGFRNVVLINASYGLGEYIVKGIVSPDEFVVFKPALKKGYKSIIKKKLGSKERKLIYGLGGNISTIDAKVPIDERKKFCISDDEIVKLALWGLKIENHYSRPMDIEWAKDGISGELFIVQARPETVKSQINQYVIKEYKLSKKSKVIVSGAAVGDKIGKGVANIIKNVKDIDKFKKGEVLITEMTDPDWEPIMKKASAIVTNSGGRTSHAAIVSRELGIPCIVGTGNATEKIKQFQKITVSCAEGDIGKVYDGFLEYKVKEINIKNLKRPKTKIMMNVGNPELAFKFGMIPSDGIGLARIEFIIANYIKIHPKALIELDKKNSKILFTRDEIEEVMNITYGYSSKSQFFIDKLSSGIATIAASCWPNPVIVRFSDFKSNEYRNLFLGKYFEPEEENPMLGFRGASRYYNELYREAFILEVKAIKKAREELGLDNIWVMIPFCRTKEEGIKVLKILRENGLRRSRKFKVYVMCEIPSNIILANEFSKIFDGFSIGSNDLTQLTLGVDRDSELVSSIFDERNKAVLNLIAEVIKKAHKNRKKVSICGEAPSNYPEFTEFLVKHKIDSISLSPEVVLETTIMVNKIERSNSKKSYENSN